VLSAPSVARTEDIVFHLYGVLLWLQSIESPHIPPKTLGTHLVEVLGEARMQTLEDWPAEQKNKAAFLAEAAFTDVNQKTSRERVAHLLRELEARIQKNILGVVRTSLREAERLGDRTRQADLLSQASEVQKKIREIDSMERRFTFD
jgi:hypothetical protein